MARRRRSTGSSSSLPDRNVLFHTDLWRDFVYGACLGGPQTHSAERYRRMRQYEAVCRGKWREAIEGSAMVEQTFEENFEMTCFDE